jgi:hypothetical protein
MGLSFFLKPRILNLVESPPGVGFQNANAQRTVRVVFDAQGVVKGLPG